MNTTTTCSEEKQEEKKKMMTTKESISAEKYIAAATSSVIGGVETVGIETAETETLECGTSLAEREFCLVREEHDDDDDDDEVANENNNNKKVEEVDTTEKTNHHSQHNLQHQQDDVANPSISKSEGGDNHKIASIESLRSLIASDVLKDHGHNASKTTFFSSPFEDPYLPVGSGQRTIQLPLVYCDQTASNRCCISVEQYMQQYVLPLYGNTHTLTSITGTQSTAFVSEARQIVAECTNAKITGKASKDVVLFAGQGTTSAIELLIDCIGLKHYAAGRGNSNSSGGDNNHNNNNRGRPVVFIGPYEHHSNLIPWRESSGCEIVMVPECPITKQINLVKLEQLLQQYASSESADGNGNNDRLLLGTFTAASNVTGKVCSNENEIAALMHKYNGYVFFDYATAAPYAPINMNPTADSSSTTTSHHQIYKDAIYLSPHKMIGCIGTPGILIIKKHLVSQMNPPNRSGGGTVFYVTNTNHRFLSNRVERYEGGTPNIPGIVRVGLCFLLKRQAEDKYKRIINTAGAGSGGNGAGSTTVNDNTIDPPQSMLEYEYLTYKRVSSYLREHAPNLILLGRDDGSQNQNQNLPIFSFLIRHKKRFLHYNYVCAILNDVFGIQSRGGCQCSGPYSQRLLGLTETHKENGEQQREEEVPNMHNKDIEEALLKYKERAELLRPGYTRLSLPFKGLHSEEVQYVMKALVWVSEHAWKLMCQYRCNHRTGEWRHWNRQGRPLGKTERRWLSHYDFTNSAITTDEELRSSSVQNSNNQSDDNNMNLGNILEETMSTADAILRAAVSDQRNIAQALKMADAEDVLGNGQNDKLEELRWYVYPKECALDLSCSNNGHEPSSLPLSADGDEILGALNPIHPKYYIQQDGVSKDDVVDTEIMASTPHTEAHTEESLVAQDAEENGEKSQTKLTIAEDGSKMFYFRDGNHSGEAMLEEISEGRDEGELSEQCEIYDPLSGVWVPVDSLLLPDSVDKAELLPSNGNKPSSSDKQIAHEQKQSCKKETRDSSSWGTGKALLPVAPANSSVKCESSERMQTEQGGTKNKKKRKGTLHEKPPPKMMRLCTQAMIQFDMLADGDRLLLGLSGGKDSLSLLHCLLEFKRKLPIKFEIEVCTIDPMTPSFDPSPLIPYVESLGLKYHYIRDDIVSRASSAGSGGKMVSSLCSFCARMKRGNLYACARKNNCNKLVLAQHLDDCAESFMMSVMHNGFLRTMKAHYKINAGDISVIRPLVYCRESLMTDFAKAANLPVINENCPACFEEPKERARVKKMLSREETLYPNFYDNIKRSLLPLMHDDMTAILRCYTESTLSKSRKNNNKRKRQRGDDEPSIVTNKADDQAPPLASLQQLSDDDLVLELARRKAEKYRLAGAMKRTEDDGGTKQPVDLTGQVCSLKGGDGSIPCCELME